jgi:phosphatidylglycerophosphatase C
MDHDHLRRDLLDLEPDDSAQRGKRDRSTSVREVIAIFDFDKTIVSKDTGSRFVFDLIKRNWLRTAAATLAVPVAAPLFLLSRTRHLGISAFLWIGTFGISDAAFHDACSQFARDFFGSKIGGATYCKSLDAVKMHIEKGHRVVVVSGSFAKLVQLIMRSLVGADVEIVASTSRPLLGGLVGHRHCVGSRKLEMTLAAGIPDRQWDYGYTDSASDIPIMRRCRKRYVINPDARTLARYRQEFRNDFDVLSC